MLVLVASEEIMANSASNNYKTTFRMEKNRKKEIPGTSVLSMNNTDTVVPGTSVISLDNPVQEDVADPIDGRNPVMNR